jgi:hypothetical protein
MPRLRAVQAIIPITNPKAMFTRNLIGATANDWTAITDYISGATSAGLDTGAVIKNIGVNSINVSFLGITHGVQTGFRLLQSEQISLSTNNLSYILVKNNATSEGITMSVYAN